VSRNVCLIVFVQFRKKSHEIAVSSDTIFDDKSVRIFSLLAVKFLNPAVSWFSSRILPNVWQVTNS